MDRGLWRVEREGCQEKRGSDEGKRGGRWRGGVGESEGGGIEGSEERKWRERREEWLGCVVHGGSCICVVCAATRSGSKGMEGKEEIVGDRYRDVVCSKGT